MRTKRTQHEEAAWCRMGERHGAALLAAAAGRLFCCHLPGIVFLSSSPFLPLFYPLTSDPSNIPILRPCLLFSFSSPRGVFLFQIVQQPWHPWTNLTSCASSSATRWMRSRTWQRPQRAFISGKPFFPSTPPSPTAKSQRLPSTPRGTS